MKKGKVFFHPIDGSGSLTISWSSEPKGDAVEAKKGTGVGFFSKKKDLSTISKGKISSIKIEAEHIFLNILRNIAVFKI